jgi:hypothetical protein
MTFDQLYSRITSEGTLQNSSGPRMGNWTLDRWDTADGFYAMIADGGYTRVVGKNTDMELWRVNDYYPSPLEFKGITKEEFEALK